MTITTTVAFYTGAISLTFRNFRRPMSNSRTFSVIQVVTTLLIINSRGGVQYRLTALVPQLFTGNTCVAAVRFFLLLLLLLLLL